MQKRYLVITLLAFMLVNCQYSSNKTIYKGINVKYQKIDSLNIKNQLLYQILDTIIAEKDQALMRDCSIFYLGFCNNTIQAGCSTIKYFKLSFNYTDYKGYFKYKGNCFFIDSLTSQLFSKTNKQRSFDYTYYKLPPPPNPSEAYSIVEFKIVGNTFSTAFKKK